MKEFLQRKLYRAAGYLEVIVSIVISLILAFLVVMMIINIVKDPTALVGDDALNTFLGHAFGLIIGIEFLKMIVKPSPDNVIETLIFAVSRQVVLDHDMMVTLLGILCMAVLFMIKKFLFSRFESPEIIMYRATARASIVNRISNVRLPAGNHTTLMELMEEKLKEDNLNAHVGAVVEYGKTALRIAKLGDHDQITRIEVIREME